MKFCYTSIANDPADRRVYNLISDDAERIARFISDSDKPGWGTYCSVNPLVDTATQRKRDQVAQLNALHCDIDYKRLATPPDTVLKKIKDSFPAAELRLSGGGIHLLLHLKEPPEAGTEEFNRGAELRKRLTEITCADPLPDHNAALLRVNGSHNTRGGKNHQVHVLQCGRMMDLLEIEELLDRFPEPFFDVLEEAEKVVLLNTTLTPVDYEAVLADMPTTGAGVNAVVPRLLWGLVVREGKTPDEACAIVVESVMEMAARTRLDWTREKEVGYTIPRMRWVLDNLQKKHWDAVDEGKIPADVPPAWLPIDWQQTWAEIGAEGLRPNIARNQHGFFLRRPPIRTDNGNGNSSMPPEAEAAEVQDVGSQSTPSPPQPLQPKGSQKIEAIPFKAFAERDLPPREFLFGKHYQRGQVTCSIGQDGAGKSTVSIAEAICMATGREILGEVPSARYRVWLHNADDDSTEMKRRIAAFCKLHQIPLTELEGWLFVTGKDNFKIKVVRGNAGGSVPDRATIAAIIKTIKENHIDVAIFDPLIHLHTVIENNNTQLAEVAEQFSDIAAVCDGAVDIVHHVRKMLNGINEKEFTSEDSRGGGALRAAVRALRVYNRMTVAEAEGGGVPADERGFYLRVDRGKANYLPPAVKSTWFHLASIILDNGDDVGAIEPWSYSGQAGSAAEKKAEDMFMFLLLRTQHAGRVVTPGKTSADYAPKVFARSPEAREAKIGVRQLEAAMERLIDRARIVIEREPGTDRHPRRIIRPVTLAEPPPERAVLEDTF
jgi:hypothetical protein